MKAFYQPPTLSIAATARRYTVLSIWTPAQRKLLILFLLETPTCGICSQLRLYVLQVQNCDSETEKTRWPQPRNVSSGCKQCTADLNIISSHFFLVILKKWGIFRVPLMKSRYAFLFSAFFPDLCSSSGLSLSLPCDHSFSSHSLAPFMCLAKAYYIKTPISFRRRSGLMAWEPWDGWEVNVLLSPFSRRSICRFPSASPTTRTSFSKGCRTSWTSGRRGTKSCQPLLSWVCLGRFYLKPFSWKKRDLISTHTHPRVCVWVCVLMHIEYDLKIPYVYIVW